MTKLYAAATLAGLTLMLATPRSASAQIVPSPPWGEPINTPGRFVVLASYNNAAVYDGETGLVWEQSPSAAIQHWQDAQIACGQKMVGNRFGWRLPTVQELASLVDPTQGAYPFLPAGHPFDFSSFPYSFWAATTWGQNPDYAWIVQLINPGIGPNHKVNDSNSAWCVRGGSGAPAQ
ncbi:MAG TPA: DUF1566 domain-containing protein [Vicinamibacterales bacterium]|jgi:hypothetical protein|nr:DUF1566 domain-containing protein [Vicinamibacterales bacterium]